MIFPEYVLHLGSGVQLLDGRVCHLAILVSAPTHLQTPETPMSPRVWVSHEGVCSELFQSVAEKQQVVERYRCLPRLYGLLIRTNYSTNHIVLNYIFTDQGETELRLSRERG